MSTTIPGLPRAGGSFPKHAARWIPIENLTQREPKAAHAYWRRILGDRAMPHPKDLDPAEIRKLLSHIALIEVLDESPPDYFFRIEGDAVQTAMGFKRMGRRLSQLTRELGPVYPRALARFQTVCESRTPMAQTSLLSGLSRSFYAIESVMLPFSRDGKGVDQILVCIGFLKRPKDLPDALQR